MTHNPNSQTLGGSVRYRRVSRDEENEVEDVKKRQSDRIERITAKIHALFWISLAAYVVYYSDIINYALYSDRVDRFAYIFFLNILHKLYVKY